MVEREPCLKLVVDPRAAAIFGKVPKRLPYQLVAVLLLAMIALQVARIIWTTLTPLGPVGHWQTTKSGGAADPTLLSRFDPFFRDGVASGSAVVTSLAVKLFGTRIDQAMGRGSAIIATPDGVQSSYAVGDEILPGVKLKSVAFDSVMIERGGVAEQVFLDQSVVAAVAQPAATGASMTQSSVTQPSQSPAMASLANEIAYTPRIENGQLTGFVVSPKGAGLAFSAAGLKAGDVLTAINGQEIRSVQDASNAMKSTGGNGVATLAIERGGKAVTVSAKVDQ
jgi:general secretion pathway protein C